MMFQSLQVYLESLKEFPGLISGFDLVDYEDSFMLSNIQ